MVAINNNNILKTKSNEQKTRQGKKGEKHVPKELISTGGREKTRSNEKGKDDIGREIDTKSHAGGQRGRQRGLGEACFGEEGRRAHFGEGDARKRYKHKGGGDQESMILMITTRSDRHTLTPTAEARTSGQGSQSKSIGQTIDLGGQRGHR